MIQKEIYMLIVEENPIIAKVYTEAIRKIEVEEANLTFNLTTANSCDSAIYYLDNNKQNQGLDLVFLDLQIAPTTTRKYLSGEDIGLHIRTNFTNTKIILASVDTSIPRVITLFRNINPEGFLFKNEITIPFYKSAITEVINNGFYYSKGVLKIMRKEIGNEFLLDAIDRKLLLELSRGTMTTHLPKVLPLSQSSITRRKQKLKQIFNVDGGSDRELLEKARELGFV
ncbi:DNA-binding response regulator [Aequorivita viscosa]|nr:DNA-binding response regulator [Aequorivita viscosa]